MHLRSIVGAVAVLAAFAAPALAIVGGREDPALSRHAVMILNDRGGFCSASVIAPDVLLTAAHCVASSAGHRVHWRDAGGEPVMVEPAAVAVHPGYVADAVKARKKSVDLALVRLAEPLPASFQPVALSAAPAPRPGETVTVAGWGVVSDAGADTGGHFRSVSVGIVEPYGPSSLLLWLSSGRAAGAGACAGDSGGPVFADDGGIVAVTAFAEGASGRGCGALTQAVLVGPQRGWIDKTLQRWGRSLD
jgi:secreted trypsin-like serine protease